MIIGLLPRETEDLVTCAEVSLLRSLAQLLDHQFGCYGEGDAKQRCVSFIPVRRPALGNGDRDQDTLTQK